MRAYIPPNITSGGGVFAGLFKKRNAAEAGAFVLLLLFLLKALAPKIGTRAALLLAVFLGLPVSAILLIGIKGKSVVSILIDLLIYKKTKGVLTIQPPKVISHAKKR